MLNTAYKASQHHTNSIIPTLTTHNTDCTLTQLYQIQSQQRKHQTRVKHAQQAQKQHVQPRLLGVRT